MNPARAATASCVLLIALAVSGCGASDPRARLLEDRARWNVTLLNWSQGQDGTVTLATRLSGPVNSKLKQLTVRIRLVDADGKVLDSRWHTFDLSDVQRGGPADKIVVFRELPFEVAGAGIDPVLSPTADERTHIPELQP